MYGEMKQINLHMKQKIPQHKVKSKSIIKWIKQIIAENHKHHEQEGNGDTV